MVRVALAGILAPFLLSACIASNRRIDALAELVREYPCPSLPPFPYRGAEAILGEDARCSLVLAARDVAARQGFGPALPIDTARIVMASIEQPSRDRHPSLVAWTVRLELIDHPADAEIVIDLAGQHSVVHAVRHRDYCLPRGTRSVTPQAGD